MVQDFFMGIDTLFCFGLYPLLDILCINNMCNNDDEVLAADDGDRAVYF